ncbi:MAG: tRNA pseudouridine(38-40) synthase TruA [bacterium]
MQKNTLTIENNKFISEEINFFRYSLVVEYAGWAFFGSQKQPGVKTVQSELENALKKLLQCDIKIIFSGRTDKGVHAKNQVAHFNVPFELNLNRFLYSLNAILSEYLSVKNVQKVDKTFHSQISANYRWYRYTINNRPQRSVWLNKTSSHIYEKLNIESMQKALDYLIGKHDFTSFKKVNSPNPVKECVMYYVGLSEKAGVINIDLIANRFLYNMVRIIAGTLIEIGKGIYPPEHMLEVLEAKDRTCAGPTAEACGLTFMLVGYDEQYNRKAIMEINDNEDLLCKAS